MNPNHATSFDQLNDLRKHGRITQEEYESLSKAMSQGDRSSPERSGALGSRPPAQTSFRRTSSDYRVAGVCGGLARRLGLDPPLVRALSVLAAIFTGPLIPIAYIVMAIMVPWDQKPENVNQAPGKKEVSCFASVLALLMGAYFVYAHYMFPGILDIFSQMAASIPLWTRLTIRIQHLLGNHLIGYLALFFFYATALGIFSVIRSRQTRRIYGYLIIACLFLFIGFLICGDLLPFLSMTEKIH